MRHHGSWIVVITFVLANAANLGRGEVYKNHASRTSEETPDVIIDSSQKPPRKCSTPALDVKNTASYGETPITRGGATLQRPGLVDRLGSSKDWFVLGESVCRGHGSTTRSEDK